MTILHNGALSELIRDGGNNAEVVVEIGEGLAVRCKLCRKVVSPKVKTLREINHWWVKHCSEFNPPHYEVDLELTSTVFVVHRLNVPNVSIEVLNLQRPAEKIKPTAIFFMDNNTVELHFMKAHEGTKVRITAYRP